jgi:hypothetical protein
MKSILLAIVFILSVNHLTAQDKITGNISTGDDCDNIKYETGIFRQFDARDKPPKVISFTLKGSGKVTWWKQLAIPLKGGGYKIISFENSFNATTGMVVINKADLDLKGLIQIFKAKMFGEHKLLTSKILVSTLFERVGLENSEGITFTWTNDTCN